MMLSGDLRNLELGVNLRVGVYSQELRPSKKTVTRASWECALGGVFLRRPRKVLYKPDMLRETL